MKIFAFIRNFPGDWESSPFGNGPTAFYTIPDSGAERPGHPVFVPDFDSEFTLHPTLALRIGRLGKGFPERFAHRYVEAAGPAAVVVAKNLLPQLRALGEPWDDALCFDQCCLVGNLQPADSFIYSAPLLFSCGDMTLRYDPSVLLGDMERLIAGLAQKHTLKNGDLLLAGISPTGFPMLSGTSLTARQQLQGHTLTDNTTLLDYRLR